MSLLKRGSFPHIPNLTTMNKYKVEIVQTQKYIVDVLAANEENAKKSATKKWNDITTHNVAHYHEDGSPETDFGTVYDVTHTDDPFNP